MSDSTLRSAPVNSLAIDNGAARISPSDYGLSIESATTDYDILSSTETSDGAVAEVLVSTRLKLVPGPSTTITIADQIQDELDMYFDDVHEVRISDGVDGFSVIGDDILPDGAISDSEVMGSMPEGSASESARPMPAPIPRAAEFGTNSAGLNYITAINYAEEWTTEDVMNPAFPIDSNSNCTNFVSQALYTGGLPPKWTVLERGELKAWNFWGNGTLGITTYTWSAADNNFRHMRDYSNSFDYVSDPYSAWQGSIIYGNWYDKDAFSSWSQDHVYDHAMFVVGNVVNNNRSTPVICQKSRNRQNYLFSDSEKNAIKDNDGLVSWGVMQYRYD